MKYVYHLAVALFLFTAVTESVAQSRPFGLGLIIGEPTGISAKLWTSNTNAFDFGLGWSVFNGQKHSRDRIHVHMDYLWHSFNAISSTKRFPLYYGLGGRFIGGADQESSIAARGVLGLAWLPHGTPIDLFIEAAPSFEITPSTGFALDAAIGVRYFF